LLDSSVGKWVMMTLVNTSKIDRYTEDGVIHII